MLSQCQQYLITVSIWFRCNHSTTTALLHGELTSAVFIDLTKLFSFVDLLSDKLHAIGLSENAGLWLNSYLHIRKQCFVLHGKDSDLLLQQKALPQASTIGPRLFSSYINNLKSNFSKCCVQLYADDTVIYTSKPDLAQKQSSVRLILTSYKTGYHIINYCRVKQVVHYKLWY